MVAPELLDIDIAKGRDLIKKLTEQLKDRAPTAAFWYLDSDEDKYSLLLASPIVDERGPRAAYGVLENVMAAIKPSRRLSRDVIRAISQEDPIVKGLRSLHGLKEGKLYSTQLPNVYFNAGYIYFVDNARAVKRGA